VLSGRMIRSTDECEMFALVATAPHPRARPAGSQRTMRARPVRLLGPSPGLRLCGIAPRALLRAGGGNGSRGLADLGALEGGGSRGRRPRRSRRRLGAGVEAARRWRSAGRRPAWARKPARSPSALADVGLDPRIHVACRCRPRPTACRPPFRRRGPGRGRFAVTPQPATPRAASLGPERGGFGGGSTCVRPTNRRGVAVLVGPARRSPLSRSGRRLEELVGCPA